MKKKKKLFLVSNAHLDTQWNWTIQDTIRDCVKHTLEDNFALFEKYPEYVMNFEGAFRYKLAKEYYPEQYEKLKKYVREGRWNVAGSQWDASDVNVPSSEALMRQILYGNGFFEAEFGKKSADIFLTDCFGFRYSLPSIAAHMGLKGFSTQKLVWGVGSPIYNKDGTVSRPMPDKEAPRMDLGKWIGPDGNYVIGSFLCGDYTKRLEKDDDRPLHDRKEYLQAIDGVPSRMMYYGTGDYGGAPSDGSAKLVNDAVKANGADKDFEIIAASSDAIFKSLTEKEIEKMPSYRGNLLIPHGYGAATSHTISKRWNRKSELLADAAERAASAAAYLGRAEYPKERLDFAWKLFLWHQFHDDLPGTSILNAYRFSYNDYVIAQNILAEELKASVTAVSRALDTNVSGAPVVVYNPVSFARTDVAAAPLPDGAEYARVFTADGDEVPSQISVRDGQKLVLFTASVAPVSFTVYNVVASDAPCALDTGLSVSLNTLENERYSVRINGDGDICSVYDKKNGKELLSSPSTLGQRDDNSTNWPSWEINYDDTQKPFEKTLTDITQIQCMNGKLYVSPILDCFDGEILALRMADNMRKELCTATLDSMVLRFPQTKGAILHSDRGSQYTSDAFRDLLEQYEMKQSLSGVDHCYDNARMESFFATLKKELIYRLPVYRMTIDEVKAWIFQYVFGYYNRIRVTTVNPGGWPPSVYREMYMHTVAAA